MEPKRPRWLFFIPLLATALMALGAATAWAGPVEGGSLDPTSIPKYVIPLVIPPVMADNGTASDTTATPNDYEIAVREFKQQILPGGIWKTLTAHPEISYKSFNPTRVWSYGPAAQEAPNVAPNPFSQFNYPAYTIETSYNTAVDVKWINDLVDDEGNYLPHLLPVDQTVHWANPPMECRDEIPRTDCAGTSDDLYEGPVPIVTHLHGARVGPESDGYPEAWWLPAANDIPEGYGTEGTLFDDADGQVPSNSGYAQFHYPNVQPATTLWYHDHSLGMTRLNVYAGPAGFWLIRGGGYDAPTVYPGGGGGPATLPGPAPTAGQTVVELNDPTDFDNTRFGIREIPIVIQDRGFDKDGSLFYPKFRSFFEGLDTKGKLKVDLASMEGDVLPHWQPEAFFPVMVVNGVSWPELQVADAMYRFRLLNGCNSRFLNLALFVVTAGDDGIYGTDDDVLTEDEIPFYQIGAEQGFLEKVLQITTGHATELPGDGTIPDPPVAASDPDKALLMGLAERADVLVDFSGLPNNTVVRMINTAPDEPFGGFNGEIDEEAVSDPGTSGQVMQFLVKTELNGKSATDGHTTDPEDLVLNGETALSGPVDETRQVSLNEGESVEVCVLFDVEEDAYVEPIRQVPCDMPDPDATDVSDGTGEGIDVVHFGPTEALLGLVDGSGATAEGIPLKWTDDSYGTGKVVPLGEGGGDPREVTVYVTENPDVDNDEEWEIYNFTVDAHPIHLHLVRFNVVDREIINADSPNFTGDPDGVAGIDNNIGDTRIRELSESGYKDTVIAYPGEITTIRAIFDIEGLYVWHCHIVEHEDNEMMRPYAVGLDDAP